MKSKKQKQLEALQRRRRDLAHWDMRCNGFKDEADKTMVIRKRSICLMNIQNLEKKLGFAAAEPVVS